MLSCYPAKLTQIIKFNNNISIYITIDININNNNLTNNRINNIDQLTDQKFPQTSVNFVLASLGAKFTENEWIYKNNSERPVDVLAEKDH